MCHLGLGGHASESLAQGRIAMRALLLHEAAALVCLAILAAIEWNLPLELPTLDPGRLELDMLAVLQAGEARVEGIESRTDRAPTRGDTARALRNRPASSLAQMCFSKAGSQRNQGMPGISPSHSTAAGRQWAVGGCCGRSRRYCIGLSRERSHQAGHRGRHLSAERLLQPSSSMGSWCKDRASACGSENCRLAANVDGRSWRRSCSNRGHGVSRLWSSCRWADSRVFASRSQLRRRAMLPWWEGRDTARDWWVRHCFAMLWLVA